MLLLNREEKFRSQLNQVSLMSREVYVNLKEQFMFCFKGAFSLLFPLWAADCFTLIASSLGTETLAAQTILKSVALITFMTPIGLSIVTQIRVTQNIGANKVDEA
jgi:Na+-driven multidrug efflux pump